MPVSLQKPPVGKLYNIKIKTSLTLQYGLLIRHRLIIRDYLGITEEPQMAMVAIKCVVVGGLATLPFFEFIIVIDFCCAFNRWSCGENVKFDFILYLISTS